MKLYFNNAALPYPDDNNKLKLEYKSSVNLVLYNITSKLGLQIEYSRLNVL